MAHIRSRGNRSTEVVLARLLRAERITGWRRHREIRVTPAADFAAKLAGKVRRTGKTKNRKAIRIRPDFVFPEHKVAIFVDGCFWRGCPIHSPPSRWLAHSSMPLFSAEEQAGAKLRTGKIYWMRKMAENRRRDRFIRHILERSGWRVIRIWEHDLHDIDPSRPSRKITALANRIRRALNPSS